jgi:hypothetical protein
MPLTTAQRINIGRLSGLYASNELQAGKRNGGLLDRRLPYLIYMVTEGLEWLYLLDPDSEDLEPIGHYLISICRHQLKAQAVLAIATGGQVAAIDNSADEDDIYPIYVTESELTEDGDYINPSIVGDNLIVFFNGNNQNFLVAGGGFEYTATGIRITMEYDETYTWVIYRRGTGTSTTTEIPTVVNYNLTENDSVIAAIAATEEGQLVTVAIKPNGFTYDWDNSFGFNDNMPKQPGAIGENTLQTYTFQYYAAIGKLVCIAQGLNTPTT